MDNCSIIDSLRPIQRLRLRSLTPVSVSRPTIDAGNPMPGRMSMSVNVVHATGAPITVSSSPNCRIG